MIKKKTDKILSYQELADLLERHAEYYKSIDKRNLSRKMRKRYKMLWAGCVLAACNFFDVINNKL